MENLFGMGVDTSEAGSPADEQLAMLQADEIMTPDEQLAMLQAEQDWTNMSGPYQIIKGELSAEDAMTRAMTATAAFRAIASPAALSPARRAHASCPH